jgi:hypothetical protein
MMIANDVERIVEISKSFARKSNIREKPMKKSDAIKGNNNEYFKK